MQACQDASPPEKDGLCFFKEYDFSQSFQPVRDALAGCAEVPFQKSQLYSSLEEKKFVDEDQRRSRFRDLTDKALFAACQGLVDHINEQEDKFHFQLVQNDITNIEYDEGDFFKPHQDYLSLTSNMIEEYTLIVCVTPEDQAKGVEGGETALEVNPKTTHVTRATTTPSHGLLFRKDVRHEGRKLVKGRKAILTMNIWAVPKNSETCVLVTFPEPDGVKGDLPARVDKQQQTSTPQKQDQEQGQKQLLSKKRHMKGPNEKRARRKCSNAMDEFVREAATVPELHERIKARAYVIPASALAFFPGSHLADFLELKCEEMKANHSKNNNRNNSSAAAMALDSLDDMDSPPVPSIVHYPCRTITYEEFSCVYKILNRMRVTAAEVEFAERAIAYFGLPARFILQDIAATAEPLASFKPGKSAESIRPPMQVAAQPSEAKDGDVIVCSSWASAHVLSSAARALGSPYVPFRIVLAEGQMDYGGEMFEEEPSVISMLPVWASLGDYNNVLGQRHLANKSCSHTFASLAGGVNAPGICSEWELPEGFAPDELTTPGHHFNLRWNWEKEPAIKQDGKLQLTLDKYEMRDRNNITSFGLVWAMESSPNLLHDIVSIATDPEDSVMQPMTVLPGLHQGSSANDISPAAPLAKRDVNRDSASALSNEGHSGDGEAGCTQAGRSASAASIKKQKAKGVALPFHRDALGNVCFTAQEAAMATRRVEELGLVIKVIAEINNTPFVLPQAYGGLDHNFCNEQVYGNFSFMMVCGVVRLGPCAVAQEGK